MEPFRTLPTDAIPRGTFFSGEYTRKRVAAIRRIIVLGRELAKSHPEVADMYRAINHSDPNRYIDIAKEFIPEIAETHPSFASRVVGYAVRQLIPIEEQAELTAKHKAKSLEKHLGGYGSEKHLKHQKNAARERHAKGIGVNVEAMLKGRGKIGWSEEEKKMVLELMIYDPEFQHQKGPQKGRPNYKVIAEVLNDMYHGGRPVRYANSILSLVSHDRMEKRKKSK